MRLGKVVLKIRAANTIFGNRVSGSADLKLATRFTLTKDMAFVIPLLDDADKNKVDVGIHQQITERFAVVVALQNDERQSKKLGLKAYDRTYDIRSEIFRAILGWQTVEAESPIFYRGGRLVGLTSNILWFQFEFEHETMLGSIVSDPKVTPHRDDGVQEYAVIENDTPTAIVGEDSWSDEPTSFDRLYANYILAPSADLPHTGELPLKDGFPDLALPDQAQWLNLTENPDSGPFGNGFGSGFDINKV